MAGRTESEVAQQKTRERLLIPRSADMDAMLAEIANDIAAGRDARQHVIFTTRTGKPWTKEYLNTELAAALAAIGHPGYTMHGLRYKAGRVLKNACCDWETIAAILGLRTMQMTRQ